jgi:pyruvate/2-oxoglutarate dehydrogenase complex dihydrolipoamide acyltransferase (E2) component
MPALVIPQDLWEEGDLTGSISVWLYEDGARVQAGDILAEVMVEKATYELVAPLSGTLRIGIQPEVVITRGSVVGSID